MSKATTITNVRQKKKINMSNQTDFIEKRKLMRAPYMSASKQKSMITTQHYQLAVFYSTFKVTLSFWWIAKRKIDIYHHPLCPIATFQQINTNLHVKKKTIVNRQTFWFQKWQEQYLLKWSTLTCLFTILCRMYTERGTWSVCWDDCTHEHARNK